MRVVVTNAKNGNQIFLTEGFEYVVYGILVTADETLFCVIDDYERWPRWYSSNRFNCIDKKIPNDWLFLFFDDKQYKRDGELRFVIGPNFIASNTESYDAFVSDEMTSRDVLWKYVESQIEVAFIDNTTALYVYDKRKMKIRMEKLSEGIIFDSDTIKSWLPPYQNKIVADLEKEQIQRLMSEYFDRHNIVYGWI